MINLLAPKVTRSDRKPTRAEVRLYLGLLDNSKLLPRLTFRQRVEARQIVEHGNTHLDDVLGVVGYAGGAR